MSRDERLSIDQALNKIAEEKDKHIDEKKARAKAYSQDMPISYMEDGDRNRFLRAGIELLKDKRLRTLMFLRVAGYSYERIAKEVGGLKPELVKALEKEAMKRIKDAITASRNSGKIPIIGER